MFSVWPPLGGGGVVPQSLVPCPSWEYPRSRQGVPPLHQDRMAYPLARTILGHPPSEQDCPLSGTDYAWTDYAAGSTPLTVSRRRTVLFVYSTELNIGIGSCISKRSTRTCYRPVISKYSEIKRCFCCTFTENLLDGSACTGNRIG